MRAYLVLGFALLAAAAAPQKAALLTTPAGTELEKDSYIATLIVKEKEEQERLIAIFVAQCEANKANGVPGFSKVPAPTLIRIRDAHFVNCVLTEEELDLLREQTELINMVQQDPLVESQQVQRSDAEKAALTTNANYPISCPETQTATNPSWGHLTQSMDLLNSWGPDGKWEFSSGWGSGITVFVLDAGVRCTHAELAGRCTNGPSFTKGDLTTKDVTGHGTHAASMIAGKTLGIARSATIVSLKVVESVQKGSTSEVMKALAYINDQLDGIIDNPVVVYLSFSAGPSANNTALHDAIVGLTMYGTINGMAIVLPAGNQNEDACNHKPGNETSTITVGATKDHLRKADYSNWGKCVDVWAHGENTLGASGFDDHNLGPRTGTSFAAATVAGAAAALLSANLEKKLITAQSARHAMIKMASPENLIGDDEFGYGHFVQLSCRADLTPVYPLPAPATPQPTEATLPPTTFAPPVPPTTGTYATCYDTVELTVNGPASTVRINIMGEPQSAVGYLSEHRCWWLRCDGVATMKWNQMLVPQDERLSLWKTTGATPTRPTTSVFEKHWAGYGYWTDITEKYQGDIMVNWDRLPAGGSVNPSGGGFDLEYSCEAGAVLPPPPPQPTLIYPMPSCKDGVTHVGGDQGRSQVITFPRKGGNYPAGHEECWVVHRCAGPEFGNEHPIQSYHFDRFRTRVGKDVFEVWGREKFGFGWTETRIPAWSGTPETTYCPNCPRTYPQTLTGNSPTLDFAWRKLQTQFSNHNVSLFRFKSSGSGNEVTESGFQVRLRCQGQCHDRLLADKTEWHDGLVDRGDGHKITTCAWYGANPNIDRCGVYGKTYPREGMTANIACCKCGGGQYEDETPVAATPAPFTPCTNTLMTNGQHWVDSDGHDCAWYEGLANRCADFGTSHARDGKTAKMACCKCGGGSGGGTPAPASACQDVKLADGSPWKDGDKAEHNCAWYTTVGAHNCETHGTQYAREGVTANAACCGCGGGKRIPLGNIPM